MINTKDMPAKESRLQLALKTGTARLYNPHPYHYVLQCEDDRGKVQMLKPIQNTVSSALPSR